MNTTRRGQTPGPWVWGADDYSMAWLSAKGDFGDAGDPYGDHVLTVRLCNSCTQHVKNSGEANEGWRFGRCATINAANATLIAASPELFEALLALASIIENSSAFDDLRGSVGGYRNEAGDFVRWSMHDALDSARAALRKATEGDAP